MKNLPLTKKAQPRHFWSFVFVIMGLFLSGCDLFDPRREDVSIVAGSAATVVLGQKNFTDVSSNQAGTPSEKTLSAPRDIHFDGTRLFIADTTNNRVLIHSAKPFENNRAADIVIGQANFTNVNANRGSGVNSNTLSGPQGVFSDGSQVIIADTGNHRVLIFSPIPGSSGEQATFVIGQANFTSNIANRGTGVVSATSLSSPTDVFIEGTSLYVVDQGNHRVLIYTPVPAANDPAAAVVIGQAAMADRLSNRGGAAAGNTLSMPTSVAVAGPDLMITDTGNHRVLAYTAIPGANGAAANFIIGQANATDVSENKGSTPTSSSLFFPVGIHLGAARLVIADQGNHRVLFFDTIPSSTNPAADRVYGQTSFTANSSNQGGTPINSSLSIPNGVFANTTDIWVADQGNNRVLRFSP